MRNSVCTGIICFGIVAAYANAVLLPQDEEPANPKHGKVYHWGGGDGLWSDATRWRPSGVPGAEKNAIFDRVRIEKARNGASHVQLDVDASVAMLRIGEIDGLFIESGRTLTISDGQPICNAGLLHLDYGARLTLSGQKHHHLFGGGRLVIAGENAAIDGTDGASSLTITEQTIEGNGRLGQGRLRIVNHGEVLANVPFQHLVVHAADDGLANHGTMRSAGGGWLGLYDTHVANNCGLIAAGHGSFVELDGSTIEGGWLSTEGSGVLRNMERPVHLRDVIIDGRYMLGPTELALEGTIRNDGLIEVVGSLTFCGGIQTSGIRIVPGATGRAQLIGPGEMTLLGVEIYADGMAQPGELVHGSNHTIRGEGFIGAGDLSIFNEGTIIADGNEMLRLNPGPGRHFVNNGSLLCIGGAGAGIFSGTFENNGTVQVRDGSRLQMIPGAVAANNAGGILVGGQWRVEGNLVPATLVLNGANILVNAAHVSLVGPVSQFPRLDSISSNNGTLELLKGRVFTTLGDFANVGHLVISAESTLEVRGSFQNKGYSTFEARLTDTLAQRALIIVDGAASLYGTLKITIDEDLPPGTIINLISANKVTGKFSNVQAPAGMEVKYTDNDVIVIIGEAADNVQAY